MINQIKAFADNIINIPLMKRKTKKEHQLAVVTINYNKAESVESLIQSLNKSKYKDFMLYIVDNNSNKACIEQLQDMLYKFKDIDISFIINSKNEGWGMAINQAVDWIHEPLLIVLNNDTRVKENTIGELVNYMNQHPEVGICGTRILNADGSLASAGGKADWLTKLTGITRENKARHNTIAPVILNDNEYVDDCAWCIKTEIMSPTLNKNPKQIIRYPNYLFLYFEELYIIRGARQNGWKVAYNPLAEVFHY